MKDAIDTFFYFVIYLNYKQVFNLFKASGGVL